MNATVIQHNMEAMFNNRQLGITSNNKSKSTEKLSSGYRINRSADDAAGLSISEKLRFQVRGLERASLNIQDGISFVQTGEGALNEVHSLLQRMRELAVQASNDTNTATDRRAIDAEIQEIKKETTRIFNDTEFNTKKIFRAPYLPDIETMPDDYKLFNINGSSQVGGVMINNKRYTWDELGVPQSNSSDWEKEFEDDNGELIKLKLPANTDRSLMHRVYEMDADNTGIYINNLLAARWNTDDITQVGNKFSFSFHGMDMSIEASDGDSLEDVIAHIKKDDISTISWDAVPTGLSGYGGVVNSTYDKMVLNVTNTNKNSIEDTGYRIKADNTGVWINEYNTKNNASISNGDKVAWTSFDDKNGSYDITDWGTQNDGSNPVTLDDSARYSFSDTTAWDGSTSDKLGFDFDFDLDEISLTEAANGIQQTLSARAVSAPIASITDDSSTVTVQGGNVNFHFQRDKLLRDFGSNGSSSPMSANVTRSRVVDKTIQDYEERKVLAEAYYKVTTSVKTTTTNTLGPVVGKTIKDSNGNIVTDDAIINACDAHMESIKADQTTSVDSFDNKISYVKNKGQDPTVHPIEGPSTPVSGSNKTINKPYYYNGNTYNLFYEYTTKDSITKETTETFDSGVYISNGGDEYRQITGDTTLYERDNTISSETRDSEGNKFKTAEAGSGEQRYVQNGTANVLNRTFEYCHYEYTMKNTDGTAIMTGKSNDRFVDIQNGIRDSSLDAGGSTPLISGLESAGSITIRNADRSTTTYGTNYNSGRSVRLSDPSNASNYTTLSFDDYTDGDTKGTRSVNLTYTPASNATRTYEKLSHEGGNASVSNLKVKVNPPEKLLHIQSGALGLQDIPIRYSALSNTIIGISGVRTLDYGQSQNAITLTDDAIDYISTVRSGFGAQQNRLEHAYAVDKNTAENTDSAESRIRDTDMAKEMVNFSKHSILEQAGQAMLSQANQNKQGILQLLT